MNQIDSRAFECDIDSIKVNAYRSFIHDCIRLNVKLYVVCSPYFLKSNQTDSSITIAKEIAKENGVDFFDYSDDSIFLNNPYLFQDINHLNDSGATLFSSLLSAKISKMDTFKIQ